LKTRARIELYHAFAILVREKKDFVLSCPEDHHKEYEQANAKGALSWDHQVATV
jgi:hypothetical protein